jgi:hypothetical protein
VRRLADWPPPRGGKRVIRQNTRQFGAEVARGLAGSIQALENGKRGFHKQWNCGERRGYDGRLPGEDQGRPESPFVHPRGWSAEQTSNSS